MIQKLLIANRGEIACRIISTCQRLGVKTIAIYSDIDKTAKHVLMSDEAYYIGPNPALESYLNVDKIIQIAKESNADAIHPGYGFLSENANFAARVEKEGIAFVGPTSKAIASMGSKDEAKSLMQKAGVPVIPGDVSQDQSTKTLMKCAQKIGLPVMLKAALGGGGKGMRIVHEQEELESAIESAKREAKNSFHDETLIIEKYLPAARHIEVQIFGDSHGQVVHLFERDCSLQRRHQKVIEEAPAPNIKDEVKQKLYDAAILAAKAINYTNAGTVEFLYDSDENIYFLEMNTRLQVEHPISEAITGVDLVEWQLMVASGEPLPLKQDEIQCSGHAFEARIYAEDPFNDFLPMTGKVEALHLSKSLDARYELGIQQGDEIGIFYDPILAKVVVHGKTRKQALQKLKSVLNDFEVIGIINNVPFLRGISKHQDMADAKMHTHYLSQHMDTILHDLKQQLSTLIGPALLAHVLTQKQQAFEHAKHSTEPNSPWHEHNAWQLNTPNIEQVIFLHAGNQIKANIQHLHQDTFFVTAKELTQPLSLKGTLDGNTLNYEISGKHFLAHVYHYDQYIHIFQDGLSEVYQYWLEDIQSEHTHNKDALVAPMPGVITNIWVKPGTSVDEGDKLLAMEAMKMEHTLSATKRGLIKSILYKVGDQVQQGTELFEFEANE